MVDRPTSDSSAGDLSTRSGRRVLHNVVAMMVSRLAMALAGLVSLPIVYAHLGSVEFGIWVVLSGLATVVSMADLGLGSAIVRQVATFVHDGDRRRCRHALGLGLVWGVALAVLGAGLVLVLWPWIADLLQLRELPAIGVAALWTTMALFAGLLLDGLAMPWRGILEGTQRYRVLAVITGGAAVFGAALAVVAVTSGGGLVDLSLTVAATSALRAALVIMVARRQVGSLSPSLAGLRRDDVRTLGGYGLRVQVTSASGAVNVELDRFLLSGFFGPAVAGGFDLGGRAVGLFRLVPVLALVAMFPMAVSRAAECGREWLDRFVVAATKYLTVFAAVGAAALVVCADPLIRLWLGQANVWAAANIAVLAPAYAVNLVSGATGILSRVEGLPGRETTYAMLSVLINLALTWPLLRLFGPIGVTLATAVGIVIGTVYFLWSYHRFTGRALRPLALVIWPSVAAAVAGGGAAQLLASHLPDGPGRGDAVLAVLGRGSIVLVVAVGVLVATRFVRRDDLGRLRELLGRRTAVAGPVVGEAV